MNENSRIFITGDCHGGQADGFKKFNGKKFTEGKNLTKNDYMIIVGDYGLIWDDSKSEKYLTDWLSNKPWTTLFLDGNHENFDLLEKLEETEMFGGKVGVHVEGNIYHLKRGEIYTIGNKTFFAFGGARSIDKHLRIDHVSWWPQEEPNYAECKNGLNNLEKYNNKVDYVITHECPTIVYETLYKKELRWGTNDEDYKLRNYLQNIKDLISFKKWYFGHYHDDLQIGEKFKLLYRDIEEINE